MQQTEKYQFNLIEGADDFSPEPLNENTQRAEALLAGRARLAAGSYTGTGQYGADNPTVLEIPDAERPPSVIIVSHPEGFYKAVLVRGMEKYCVWWENYRTHNIEVTWTDKGVRWYSTEDSGIQLNTKDQTFYYAAII